MDLDGNIAIEPRYDRGGEFAEGLAAVQLEGHWTFIDKSGAVPAEFPAGIAFAEPISEGLSLVSADRDQSGRKFGYVDRNGTWAIKPIWDDAHPPSSDLDPHPGHRHGPFTVDRPRRAGNEQKRADNAKCPVTLQPGTAVIDRIHRAVVPRMARGHSRPGLLESDPDSDNGC